MDKYWECSEIMLVYAYIGNYILQPNYIGVCAIHNNEILRRLKVDVAINIGCACLLAFLRFHCCQ